MARRAVALALFVLLLCALAWGAKALVTWWRSPAVGEETPAEVATPSSAAEWGELSEEERFKEQVGRLPEECPADSLNLAVNASSLADGGVQLEVTIDNTYPVPCTVGTSKSPLTATISSGDDTIWSTTTCPGDPTVLLLPGGEQATRTITWPGTRRTSGCDAEGSAEAGVYHAEVSIRSATAEVAFEVR
ncbi:MAG: hypothetical protein Q4P36_02095 [Bowdeniella nasicola]|nr:hypothetical protein [Bowdeniella nasicola]